MSKFYNWLSESQGRGAAQTKFAESAQCIGIAIYQLKGNLSKQNFTIENAKKASKFYDIGNASIEDTIMFVHEKESWMDSTINTIEALKNKKILKSKRYICHRDSKLMKDIYKQFNKLSKESQKIIGKIGQDKWNPGDIWLSTINNIPEFDNLLQYNKWIDNKFDNGELIALSLKKSPKPNPPVKIYNKFESDNNIPFRVEFNRIKLVKNPFYTHAMSIITSHGIIDVRSFDAPKNVPVTLEIQGDKAAGGKVKLELANFYFKKMSLDPVIDKTKILQMSENDRIKLMKDLYNKVGMNFSEDLYSEGFTKQTQKAIEKYGEKYIDGWWISKIQSLDLCSKLYNNKDKANEIITYLFQYASSQGLPEIFQSSVFVKVGN